MTLEDPFKPREFAPSSCRSLLDELMEEPAPPLLRDNEENPFRNSWEAEAFAMGNLLIKQGFMTQADWYRIFGEEIKLALQQGDPDQGDTYYNHWMNALERIVVERGLVEPDTLRKQQRLWGLARSNTPHGVPLSLENALNPPDAPHHHHDHDHGHLPPEELLQPIAVEPQDAAAPG